MINESQHFDIMQYLLNNGGATIELGYSSFDKNCQALYFIQPKTGYAVSIKNAEQITDNLTIETLNAYISKNHNLLTSGNGYYLGIWIDNGKFYLDISRIYQSIYNAIDECNFNNQIEYYDFKLGKSVKTHG